MKISRKYVLIALSTLLAAWMGLWVLTGNPLAIVGAVGLLFKKATWKTVWMWIMKTFLRGTLQWIYSLTGLKILTIFLKKLAMEGLIGKFLKEHLIDHLIPSLKRLWGAMGRRMKLLGVTFAAMLPVSIVAAFQVIAGGISGLGVFVVIKLIVTATFKLILAIILKIWGLADNLIHIPFLGTILEIFAFSALIAWFESRFPWLKKMYTPFVRGWNIISKQFWRLYKVLTGGSAKRVEGGSKWLAAHIDRLAGYQPHQIRLRELLEQKKQKQKEKPNHPENDGAQIRGFDARRARKHRPNRNQQKR